MKLRTFQVDAFAENLFEGNPAAVVPLQEWLSDEIMQKIAVENNLSETAFFINTNGSYHIRWFTPATEVNLCGHATLATAHILFNHLGYDSDIIEFQSRSGILKVKNDTPFLTLDFPVGEFSPEQIPEGIKSVLGNQPVKCYQGKDDYMMIFENESIIEKMEPVFSLFPKSIKRGLIVTAPGKNYDFVSRFFAPAAGINEDPVTGSAHTLLIPYWAKKLNKTKLLAKQISKRGGVLHCELNGNRVSIGGKAVTFFEGIITGC